MTSTNRFYPKYLVWGNQSTTKPTPYYVETKNRKLIELLKFHICFVFYTGILRNREWGHKGQCFHPTRIAILFFQTTIFKFIHSLKLNTIFLKLYAKHSAKTWGATDALNRKHVLVLSEWLHIILFLNWFLYCSFDDILYFSSRWT